MQTRRRALAIGAGIGAVVLLLAIAGILVISSGGDEQTAAVHLIAADTPGPDPFTASVATVDVATARRFAAQRRATAPSAPTHEDESKATFASHHGDEAGLHGATPQPSCDVPALRTALDGDPEQAAAWASAAGIDRDDVDAHLDSLVPGVLGADTLVTNHGWANGSATSFGALLEGGTAVLLDDHGTPRVRCACGNPLTAAKVQDDALIRLEGDRWDGFDAAALAIVQPAGTPQGSLQLADIATGAVTAVPVGGLVLDGYLAANEQGVQAVADDGTVTSIADTPAQLAFTDGAGGVIYIPAWADDQPTTEAEATVWHLAAGASEPTKLLTTDNPSQVWPDVHNVIALGERRLLLYEEVTPVSDGSGERNGELWALDLATGQKSTVPDAGSYPGGTMWSVTSNGDQVAWLSSADQHYYQFLEGRDATLANDIPLGWLPFGTDIAEVGDRPCDVTSPPSCPIEIAFLDDDTMIALVRGGAEPYPLAVLEVDLRNDGALRAVATIDNPARGRNRLSVRDHAVLISTEPFDGPGVAAVMVDLQKGTVADTLATGNVSFIDVPIRRPRPITDGGSTTTSAPSSTSTAIDSTTASSAPVLGGSGPVTTAIGTDLCLMFEAEANPDHHPDLAAALEDEARVWSEGSGRYLIAATDGYYAFASGVLTTVDEPQFATRADAALPSGGFLQAQYFGAVGRLDCVEVAGD